MQVDSPTITILFYSRGILDDARVYIDSKGAPGTVRARSNFHYLEDLSRAWPNTYPPDILDVPLDVNT